MPDLSVEQRTAPCSNSFCKIEYKKLLPADAAVFPVGYSHKSGLQLITPDQVKNELQWMSGRKT